MNIISSPSRDIGRDSEELHSRRRQREIGKSIKEVKEHVEYLEKSADKTVAKKTSEKQVKELYNQLAKMKTELADLTLAFRTGSSITDSNEGSEMFKTAEDAETEAISRLQQRIIKVKEYILEHSRMI